MDERGWERHVHPNGKAFYKRPIDSGGGKVNRKRDLTENENSEFGDVLFPGRSKKTKIQDSDQPSKTVQLSQEVVCVTVFRLQINLMR